MVTIVELKRKSEEAKKKQKEANKRSARAMKAYVNGARFEKFLMKELNLERNPSYSPDLAGYDEKKKRTVLVEAKYSDKEKGTIVYLDQLGRIERIARTQRDIDGKLPKTYYAFGFDDRVYMVPVEKLSKLANESERRVTLWAFSPRGKSFLNALKRVRSSDMPDEDKKVIEMQLKERYGKPYVRLKEKDIEDIADEEFKIKRESDEPVKKKKKLRQVTFD